jgi:uncharacterized secreted repeat protein (TIGR03808 family)
LQGVVFRKSGREKTSRLPGKRGRFLLLASKAAHEVTMDRRRLLRWSGAASAFGAASAALPQRAAAATTASALGLDATQMGVRAGSAEDQTGALQRAIERAAAARVPLVLPPGTYRTGALKLPAGAALVGIPGATRLVYSGGPSLLGANHVDQISLIGMTLDGSRRTLPPREGLVHFEFCRGVRIADCAILSSGGHGIMFANIEGEVTGSTIADAADVALWSYDAQALRIAGNTVTNAGNNGIQVIRSAPGHDGTMVLDNRIDATNNRLGGSGQYGNAINAFRAGDVIVRGNIIRQCAFSGVRGNTASNIQIVGNTVHQAGEVALYSEFAFEGAVIAQNLVDGAETGVSVANFMQGGRLAVVQGNIFRNLQPKDPNPPASELRGVGIYVEADTTVTGNVVENARDAGIIAGWGNFLRDVAVTGNVVRQAGIGIGVSVVPGAGSALVSSNVITGSRRGAILGMDHARPVTGELAKDGAQPHAHLSIAGNRVG